MGICRPKISKSSKIDFGILPRRALRDTCEVDGVHLDEPLLISYQPTADKSDKSFIRHLQIPL